MKFGSCMFHYQSISWQAKYFSSVNIETITQTLLYAKDMKADFAYKGSTYRKSVIPEAISAMAEDIQSLVLLGEKLELIWLMVKRIDSATRKEIIRIRPKIVARTPLGPCHFHEIYN